MYISLPFVSFSFCADFSCCAFILFILMINGHFKMLSLWDSWSYSGTLAYLVDANSGRSSTAVALNSVFRGVFAFVATEITVPLQVCNAFWCYEIFSYTFTSRML